MFGTACPANGNSQLQFAENFDKIPEHLGIQSHTLFHICPENKNVTGNSLPSSKLNYIHLVFCFAFVFISDLALLILNRGALGLVDSVTNLNIRSQVCRTCIEIITCSLTSS